MTPIDELINEFGITIEKARSELARLEIYSEVAEKKISSMSGGEKTRVALAKLILTGANFLLLDEPTNHLDLSAREAIETALENFEGTVLIVTHDRYLLDKVTNRVVEFNHVEPIIEKNKSKSIEESQNKSTNKKISKSNNQNIEKLEVQIKMAELELKMIEHEINNEIDGDKLKKLAEDHENKINEIDELYQRWEELA